MADEEDIVRPRRQLACSRGGRKRSFSYEPIDGFNFPVIYRNGKKYLSVGMAEAVLLCRYPNVIPPTLMTGRKCWSLYVTPAEAALLNEINMEHDFLFGQKCFTTSDVIVELQSFMDFYDIVRDCIKPVSQDRRTALDGGWLQINDTICPYVWRNHIRWVPLSVVSLAAEMSLRAPSADNCEGTRANCSRSSSSSDTGCLPTLDRKNTSRITLTEAAFLNALCARAGRDFCFDFSTDLISLIDVRLACNVIIIDLPPSVDPFSWGRCIVAADADAVEAFKQEVQAEWDKWRRSMVERSDVSPTGSELAETPGSFPHEVSDSGCVSPEPAAAFDQPPMAKLPRQLPANDVDDTSAPVTAYSPLAPAVSGSKKRCLPKPPQLFGPTDVKVLRLDSQSPVEDGSVTGHSEQDPEVAAIVDSLLAHFPVLRSVVPEDRGSCDPDVLRLIAWFVHVQQCVFEALRRQRSLIDKLAGVDKVLRTQSRFIVTDMLTKPVFWLATEHDFPERLQALLHYAMSTMLLGLPTHNLLSFVAGGLFNAHAPVAVEHFAFVRSVVVVALTAQGLNPPEPPTAAYHRVEQSKNYLQTCVTAWSRVRYDVLNGLDDLEAFGVALSAVYDRVYGSALGATKAAVSPEVWPHKVTLGEEHEDPTATAELRLLNGCLVPCISRSNSRDWWVPVHYAAKVLFPGCTVDEFLLVIRDVARLPLSSATPGEYQRLRSLVASKLGVPSYFPTETCRVVDLRALHRSIGQLHQWLSRTKTSKRVGGTPMASQNTRRVSREDTRH